LKILATVLIVIMAISALLVGCTEGAKFEAGSLEISPNPVAAGEPATVSVEVANVGGSEGTYTAELTVDDVEAQTEEVSVAEGDSGRLVFSVIKESLGSYEIEVADMKGTLTVVEPPEFEVGPISTMPRVATLCKPFTVNAEVTNVGEIEGAYTAVLRIDGVDAEAKDVTVAAGKKATVSFTVTKDDEGDYDLAIGDSHIILPVRPG
jgi:uncharacterized protein YfaS (alpha-2-macroglobulin family)